MFREMKTLVIIVTYNGMKWLPRCLESVRGRDLFIVDNDSTDGSADFIEKAAPEAKLIRSAENLGFTKANTHGFEYALRKGYDFVYLLNQDAWLEEGSLDILIAASQAHPGFAVLSPLQMTDGYADLDAKFARIARKAGLRQASSVSVENLRSRTITAAGVSREDNSSGPEQ